MTEREQVNKTYQKIRAKYPNVTDENEITDLAIKLEKRNSLLISLGCLAGAIVCGLIYWLLSGSETYSETAYVFFTLTLSGVISFAVYIERFFKAEQKYRPVIKAKNNGRLDADRIKKDGKRVLKKENYEFNIIKLPLYDKAAESNDDTTQYTYYLHFKFYDDQVYPSSFQVKHSLYKDAVIGEEYYVVITPTHKIAFAYQAASWSVDDGLVSYFTKIKSPKAGESASAVGADDAQ